MAFESLTERLNGVFKKLRGKGKLNEADIKAAMREVRMALLEADVNYKVAKDFCAHDRKCCGPVRPGDQRRCFGVLCVPEVHRRGCQGLW